MTEKSAPNLREICAQICAQICASSFSHHEMVPVGNPTAGLYQAHWLAKVRGFALLSLRSNAHCPHLFDVS